MNAKKTFPWIVVSLIGVVLAVIWIGFFLPDPSYVHRLEMSGRGSFLWVPRIIIPLLFIFIIFLVLFREKRIIKTISYLIITCSVLILLSYPLLNAVFFKINNGRVEKYHPYLQLKPNLPHDLNSNNTDKMIKIFCLGGSTTEFRDSKGIGWPEKLENELKQSFNNDSIVVFNLGRQWYSSLHILINYAANLRKYKPDVIIFMENINDLLQNADFSHFSTGPFRTDYGHFLGPSTNIFRSNGLISSIWLRYKMKIQHLWYYKTKEIVEQNSFPGLESYTQNINTLIDIAGFDSTQVILMSQPNLYTENMDEDMKSACYMVNMEAVGKTKKWSYETAREGMKVYNQRLKEISEDKNVFFVDMESQIPKSLGYFSDDVHYTDTTHNIISTILAEEIMKMELLQP